MHEPPAFCPVLPERWVETATDDAVRVVICARPRADIVSNNVLSVDHPSRPCHARAERPAHHPGAGKSKW